MLARLLLGVLALGLPDEYHNWTNFDQNVEATEKVSFAAEGVNNILVRIQNSAKLHVGMLTISLLICLAFGGYVGYSYWTEKNNLLGHARNLVIAFTCRIFFSILFDGVVILGSGTTAQGANTLLAFECICQNLVFAFWLMLTVYLHERVQSKFNSEPTLTLYEYGIPGVAVFFALVWIFALQSEFPSSMWWLSLSPLPQWIVSSLKLLYLLIQLGLVVDMGRTMLKTSFDNDSVSLLRKSVAILVGLILLFWLQFGLSVGRLPWKTSQSYQYFDYFIDGSQGGLFCLGFFFFNMWVPSLLNSKPIIFVENEETPKPTYEVLLNGIEKIDKVFKVKERGSWKDPEVGAESRDVMYSTVVEPHRLQKTLDLYKRLNILPSSPTTVLDGEQYHDCRTQRSIVSESGDSDKADFHSVISDDFRSLPGINRNTGNLTEQVQKKNAFYASKYLILDSKESDIPKFLQTRPSVSSVGKESKKVERSERGCFPSVELAITEELINKWLNDISENRQNKTEAGPGQGREELSEEVKTTTARDCDRDSVQTAAQKLYNRSNKSESAGSTDTSVLANATSDSNKKITKHPEKDTDARTLILKETTVFNLPILRNHFDRSSKSKLSNKNADDSKTLQPKSEGAASFQPNGEWSSVHERKESSKIKRRKTTHDPDEHQPTPAPRQIGKSTSHGTVAEPQCIRQSKFIPNAPSLTLTPVQTDLISSEVSSATQSGRLSSVIYSTFNSLFNFGDGLFRSRSTLPVAKTNSEVPQVVMPEPDEHFGDGFRLQAGIRTNDSCTPGNAHDPKSDIPSTTVEMQQTEVEVKCLANRILENQCPKEPAPGKVEKQVQLSTVRETQKPQETQERLETNHFRNRIFP